jgi:ABC-type transport system involved in Fe-S cluster assembly fused permease/ATPase subunit
MRFNWVFKQLRQYNRKICLLLYVIFWISFVDCVSQYMRVMKPTWCTIYLQFIQSLYLYMVQAC